MYVYLLRSKDFSNQTYVGMTQNLKNRLKVHNAGGCKYSSKFRPWKMIVAIWFDNPEKAVQFEKYLKIGSGHSFARRHFW
jgi:putative endonuclease